LSKYDWLQQREEGTFVTMIFWQDEAWRSHHAAITYFYYCGSSNKLQQVMSTFAGAFVGVITFMSDDEDQKCICRLWRYGFSRTAM